MIYNLVSDDDHHDDDDHDDNDDDDDDDDEEDDGDDDNRLLCFETYESDLETTFSDVDDLPSITMMQRRSTDHYDDDDDDDDDDDNTTPVTTTTTTTTSTTAPKRENGADDAARISIVDEVVTTQCRRDNERHDAAAATARATIAQRHRRTYDVNDSSGASDPLIMLRVFDDDDDDDDDVSVTTTATKTTTTTTTTTMMKLGPVATRDAARSRHETLRMSLAIDRIHRFYEHRNVHRMKRDALWESEPLCCQWYLCGPRRSVAASVTSRCPDIDARQPPDRGNFATSDELRVVRRTLSENRRRGSLTARYVFALCCRNERLRLDAFTLFRTLALVADDDDDDDAAAAASMTMTTTTSSPQFVVEILRYVLLLHRRAYRRTNHRGYESSSSLSSSLSSLPCRCCYFVIPCRIPFCPDDGTASPSSSSLTVENEDEEEEEEEEEEDDPNYEWYKFPEFVAPGFGSVWLRPTLDDMYGVLLDRLVALPHLRAISVSQWRSECTAVKRYRRDTTVSVMMIAMERLARDFPAMRDEHWRAVTRAYDSCIDAGYLPLAAVFAYFVDEKRLDRLARYIPGERSLAKFAAAALRHVRFVREDPLVVGDIANTRLRVNRRRQPPQHAAGIKSAIWRPTSKNDARFDDSAAPFESGNERTLRLLADEAFAPSSLAMLALRRIVVTRGVRRIARLCSRFALPSEYLRATRDYFYRTLWCLVCDTAKFIEFDLESVGVGGADEEQSLTRRKSPYALRTHRRRPLMRIA